MGGIAYVPAMLAKDLAPASNRKYDANNAQMTVQSAGGKARAEKLSPDRRAEIASLAAQARWSKPRADRQCVYVIGPDEGPQKIGIAGRPDLRRAGLQNGNPAKLHVWLELDTQELPARQVEQAAHAKLGADRLLGEWFNVAREVAIAAVHEAVEDLRQGRPIAGLGCSSRSIRLSDEAWSWLGEQAAAQQRSVNWIVGALVDQARAPVPMMIPKETADLMAAALRANPDLQPGEFVIVPPISHKMADYPQEQPMPKYEFQKAQEGGGSVSSAVQLGPTKREPGALLKKGKK